jgi:hypothetical protein
LEESIQIVSAKILVTDTVFQHLVNRLKNAVCDSDRGSFVACPASNLPEARLQVSIFRSRCSQRRLYQGATQVHVALTLLFHHTFAGALVVSRANTRPCSGMSNCREDAHIHAKFCDHG